MTQDTSTRSKANTTIAQIALKNSLITKENFEDAMAECANAEDIHAALKEYFIANKLISEKNMSRLETASKAMQLRQKDFKFGAIAIKIGLINRSVLELALEEQKRDFKNNKQPKLIGDMLVAAGMITVDQRDFILKKQKRLIQEMKSASPETAENDGKAGGAESPKPLSGAPPAERKEATLLRGGIKLEISHDKMAAFLTKTDDFDETLKESDIRDLLDENNIRFGIVDDSLITGFLKSRVFKTKGFMAAKGIDPVEGKDARIEYFFDTNPLKAGGLDTNGTIDFKERGEIPQVAAGTVLAEKTPLQESVNGRNIFGEELFVRPANDIAIKYNEKNTTLSEDGAKLIATVKGYPKLSWSRTVSVLEEFITKGDVDYETGHVKYDGNVTVKGTVKSGFKVIGHDIKAEEIDGGIIHADGNVTVKGGVNEAAIYARGNVYARFVHNATIECMGSVFIAKEIIDSKVQNSGAFNIKDGKVLSSDIVSKMGVSAKNVGTDRSTPTVLKTGMDYFVERELERIKKEKAGIQQQIKEMKDKKNTLLEQNLKLNQETSKLALLQEKLEMQQKEAAAALSASKKADTDKDEITSATDKLQKIKAESGKVEKKLNAAFSQIKNIEMEIGEIDSFTGQLEKKAAELTSEKDHISQWSEENPGSAVVKVEQTVYPGTVICGVHSSRTIEEKMSRVVIKELGYKKDAEQKTSLYEMKIVSK